MLTNFAGKRGFARGIWPSVAACAAVIAAASSAAGYTTAQHWFWRGHRMGHTLQLGPYECYSSVSYDFKAGRVPRPWPREEKEIYRPLLVSSLAPKYALVQLSIYPLPTLPPALETNYPDLYEHFQITSRMNLVRVLATGAEEPYALSLFVGDIAPFLQQGGSGRQVGSAIMGFVGTVSWHRILGNDIVRDVGLEFTWRVKGRVEQEGMRLVWSFEVGPKFHTRRGLPDVLVIGFRRRRDDPTGEGSFWFRNAQFALETQIPIHNPGGVRTLVSRQRIMVGKRFPVGWYRVRAVWVIAGFLWERRRAYDPEAEPDRALEFLLRPTLDFQ